MNLSQLLKEQREKAIFHSETDLEASRIIKYLSRCQSQILEAVMEMIENNKKIVFAATSNGTIGADGLAENYNLIVVGAYNEALHDLKSQLEQARKE